MGGLHRVYYEQHRAESHTMLLETNIGFEEEIMVNSVFRYSLCVLCLIFLPQALTGEGRALY